MWNFYVGDSQVKHRYYTIVGYYDIFSETNTNLCLYDNTTMGNGSAYKVCTTLMKEFSKINFNAS